jgi:hypothetical protein
MKPFDLEAAKAGEPIMSKDGTPAKFIAHVPEADELSRLVVMIGNRVLVLRQNGRFLSNGAHDFDLFMAPKTRTVWVNFYKYGRDAEFFSTKEHADEQAEYRKSVCRNNRIGNRAYPVEIEE